MTLLILSDFSGCCSFRVLEILSEMDRSQAKREHGGIRSPPVSTAQQWTWLAHAWSLMSQMCQAEAPPRPSLNPLPSPFFWHCSLVQNLPIAVHMDAVSQTTSEPVGIPLLAADQHVTYVRRFAFNHFFKDFWKLKNVNWLLAAYEGPIRLKPQPVSNSVCVLCRYEGRTVVLLRWQAARLLLLTPGSKEVKHRCRCLEQVYQLFWRNLLATFCHSSTFFACRNPSWNEMAHYQLLDRWSKPSVK